MLVFIAVNGAATVDAALSQLSIEEIAPPFRSAKHNARIFLFQLTHSLHAVIEFLVFCAHLDDLRDHFIRGEFPGAAFADGHLDRFRRKVRGYFLHRFRPSRGVKERLPRVRTQFDDFLNLGFKTHIQHAIGFV